MNGRRTGKKVWSPRTVALVFSLWAFVALSPLPAECGRDPEPQIHFSSGQVAQGDLVFLRARVGKGETPRITWMERSVPLVACGDGLWCGFLGVDLKSAPKTFPVKMTLSPSGRARAAELRVQAKNYGERRMTLPRDKVDLDDQTLVRVKRESAVMKKVLDHPLSEPLWRGTFMAPVQGELTGAFGRGNIINGEARSPHSGVDLKAEAGRPVGAMNHGRVALVADHFFSGLSVVVDHGGGIQSMYFHLEKILVKDGQTVKKGDVIGRVGSTGRSTGPHLHLGVRVNSARVDPLRLIELSKGME